VVYVRNNKMKSSSASDMCAKSSGDGDSGGGGGGDHKMCTSYHEQNVEHCKKDGADDSRSRNFDAIRSFCKAAESDDELYKDPPPKEECPICLLPMPYAVNFDSIVINKTYQACCGKLICKGCVLAAKEEVKKGNMKDLCPFCRTPTPSTDEEIV